MVEFAEYYMMASMAVAFTSTALLGYSIWSVDKTLGKVRQSILKVHSAVRDTQLLVKLRLSYSAANDTESPEQSEILSGLCNECIKKLQENLQVHNSDTR